MKKQKLTDKQKLFCDIYIQEEPNSPDVEARLKAANSAYKCKNRKSALATAKENLKKDQVVKYIVKNAPHLAEQQRERMGDLKPAKIISNPRRVAIKIKKQIIEGNKPNFYKAMKETGYGEASSRTKAKEIKEKEDFKREIEDLPELLDGLILDAVQIMRNKKAKASYKDGTGTIKDLTRTKRLLQGESTEKIDISSILDELEEK